MEEDTFYKDLQFGQKGEGSVRILLESKGATFVKDNHDKKYDLMMNYKGKDIKYEVKTDKFTSGNLLIEFIWDKKPSGIETTESDYYAFYMIAYDKVWFIETEKLKKLIADNKFEIKACGYKKLGRGYLIVMDDFKEYFKIYNII